MKNLFLKLVTYICYTLTRHDSTKNCIPLRLAGHFKNTIYTSHKSFLKIDIRFKPGQRVKIDQLLRIDFVHFENHEEK